MNGQEVGGLDGDDGVTVHTIVGFLMDHRSTGTRTLVQNVRRSYELNMEFIISYFSV